MSIGIRSAEVVLPCRALAETVAWLTGRLGFRIEVVTPADDPREVVVSGHGLRVRLRRDPAGSPAVLRVACDDPAAVAAAAGTASDPDLTPAEPARSAIPIFGPDGIRVELVAADPPLAIPPLAPSLVVTRLADAAWVTGRAGMRYRDLIPGRQGGRFVASHIHIPDGGPVPDYVHYHRVRFQMIFCYRGWARLVYEDQGPPFVLRAGDCVVQPPRIRHRVIECSAGTEVVELGCPAEHETLADHELALPTAAHERDFDGQRFVHHRAADARWEAWRLPGFEARDTGIGAATGGVAGVVVARAAGATEPTTVCHDAELVFLFVLAGEVTLDLGVRGDHRLGPGDAAVVPAGVPHALAARSDALELLEVALPARFRTTASDHGS